jgi:hypothetical protein
MLTLSGVMMPWDWMGMVTIRSDTRRSTSISGTINRRPASAPHHPAQPEQDPSLVLLDDPDRQCQRDQPQHGDRHKDGSKPFRSVPFYRYRMCSAPAPCGSSCPSRSGRRTG